MRKDTTDQQEQTLNTNIYPYLFLAGLCFSYQCSAATLIIDQVNQPGRLLGAKGVVVEGSTYDVLFVEDRCINRSPSGLCEEYHDVQFDDIESAIAASQALLDLISYMTLFQT